MYNINKSLYFFDQHFQSDLFNFKADVTYRKHQSIAAYSPINNLLCRVDVLIQEIVLEPTL